VAAFVTDPVNTGVTFAIIAAGLPVYWVAFVRRGAAARPEKSGEA
jgi:hypothetical protein